jgi:hypothetical protein
MGAGSGMRTRKLLSWHLLVPTCPGSAARPMGGSYVVWCSRGGGPAVVAYKKLYYHQRLLQLGNSGVRERSTRSGPSAGEE